MAMTEFHRNLANQATEVPAPRTISSAVGRSDALCDRLNSLIAAVSNIADQIGGPRDAGVSGGKEQPVATGALHRLHDGIDGAHNRVSELDNLVQGIQRLLG